MTEPNPRTLLVVDDEEVVRVVTQRMLERAGYNVLLAENGHAALDLCRHGDAHIDLLLTDVNMPRVNGVELARCLGQIHPGVPVIFMTGFAGDTPAKRLLTTAPNMDGHTMLHKPFTSSELVQTVERMLKPHSAGSEA